MGTKTSVYLGIGLLVAVLGFCAFRSARHVEVDLHQRVVQMLTQQRLRHIVVKVHGQTIELSGSVANEAQRSRVLRAVASLRGVRGIGNRLTIRPFEAKRDSLRDFRKWLTKIIIYFPANQWRLSEKGKKVLAALADSLKKHATVRIRLVGYSDSTGSSKRNLFLSQRRAETARLFLQQRGIDGRRLFAQGEGARHPCAPNATPEGRARNRRVACKLMENP